MGDIATTIPHLLVSNSRFYTVWVVSFIADIAVYTNMIGTSMVD